MGKCQLWVSWVTSLGEGSSFPSFSPSSPTTAPIPSAEAADFPHFLTGLCGPPAPPEVWVVPAVAVLGTAGCHPSPPLPSWEACLGRPPEGSALSGQACVAAQAVSCTRAPSPGDSGSRGQAAHAQRKKDLLLICTWPWTGRLPLVHSPSVLARLPPRRRLSFAPDCLLSHLFTPV